MDNMKTVEFGEFFIRTSSSEANLGILFELCVSYIRTVSNIVASYMYPRIVSNIVAMTSVSYMYPRTK